VCIVCCDGLKGLPEPSARLGPAAVVQTCVVATWCANSLRYAARKYWGTITGTCARSTPPPSRGSGRGGVSTSSPLLGGPLPGDDRHVASCLDRVRPFLDFPVEVRKMISPTQQHRIAHARFRAATRRRGTSRRGLALKVLYSAVIQPENETAPTHRADLRLEQILNVLSLTTATAWV